MTTITIKNGELSRTEFESLEDLQIELALQQEQFELTNDHKQILDERLIQADKNLDQGLSWQKVKADLRRKHG